MIVCVRVCVVDMIVCVYVHSHMNIHVKESADVRYGHVCACARRWYNCVCICICIYRNIPVKDSADVRNGRGFCALVCIGQTTILCVYVCGSA